MNKNVVLRVLNFCLFLSVVLQATTAVIFLFELEGSYTGLLGRIHMVNGIILIALAVSHLLLNWNWVKSVYFPKQKPVPAPAAK